MDRALVEVNCAIDELAAELNRYVGDLVEQGEWKRAERLRAIFRESIGAARQQLKRAQQARRSKRAHRLARLDAIQAPRRQSQRDFERDPMRTAVTVPRPPVR